MSVLKIKRDIELLEKQLNEIEANIADPIERIERKKQLEREIKKLERSKSQIEQLEQEQQELESLKSEFLVNSHELVNQRQPEQDKQQENRPESIFSATNNSISETPKINVNKEVKDNSNSRVDNLDSQLKNSNTTLTTPPSNNSKKPGKAWIIVCTVGFFIFLGIAINGNRTNQTESNVEQQTSDTIPSETFEQDNIPETEKIINSLPKVSSRLQEQTFNNYDFPLESCGDKDPGGTNTWYPVYVNDTQENLNIIRSNYCQDSILKYRQQGQLYSIQVASFIDEPKAEQFANLMQAKIGSGEVGEPTVYNFDNTSNSLSSQNYLTNNNIANYNLNENYKGIDESESITHITKLYDLLSKKSFDEAKLLYDSQVAYQFDSKFFSQFKTVTVKNLRATSRTKNSIDFIGENTYILLDCSTQKESRSYKIENFNGHLEITASKFIKVTKFR